MNGLFRKFILRPRIIHILLYSFVFPIRGLLLSKLNESKNFSKKKRNNYSGFRSHPSAHTVIPVKPEILRLSKRERSVVFTRARCTFISQMSSRERRRRWPGKERRRPKNIQGASQGLLRARVEPEGKMSRSLGENRRICEGISDGVLATSDRVIIRAVRHGTGKARRARARFPQEKPLIEQTSSLSSSPEIKPARRLYSPARNSLPVPAANFLNSVNDICIKAIAVDLGIVPPTISNLRILFKRGWGFCGSGSYKLFRVTRWPRPRFSIFYHTVCYNKTFSYSIAYYVYLYPDTLHTRVFYIWIALIILDNNFGHCSLNRSKNTRRIECAWNAMNASTRFYVNDKYRIF